MIPAVTYPDPEALLVPVVTDVLDRWGESASCGRGRPDGWTPAEGLHVEVAWDGTPLVRQGVVAWPTVRIVVHGSVDRPSEVKALALLLSGVLPAEFPAAKLLVGVDADSDPDRPDVQLAAFTCRVTTRAQLVEPSGS